MNLNNTTHPMLHYGLCIFLLLSSYGCALTKPKIQPLTISVVEIVTNKETYRFRSGINMMSGRMIFEERKPPSGHTFVIVVYQLTNGNRSETKYSRIDFQFVDGSGKSVQYAFGRIGTNEGTWGSYSSRTIPPLSSTLNKELFVVRDDVLENSKVIFNGIVHPINYE